MCYDVVESLPEEFRTFIEDQRRVLAEVYNRKIRDIPIKKRPNEMNLAAWTRHVRAMFAKGCGKAYFKACEVILGLHLLWD